MSARFLRGYRGKLSAVIEYDSFVKTMQLLTGKTVIPIRIKYGLRFPYTPVHEYCLNVQICSA
jgi:hypothetical protein